MGLKYNGRGFIVGIPSRDLSAEEVEKFGKDSLLVSGLYEEIKSDKKADKKPAQNKPPKEE